GAHRLSPSLSPRRAHVACARKATALHGTCTTGAYLGRQEVTVKVKLVLPALTEATSPFFRPIKYSLFPPLGLATLAAYLDDGDEAVLVDEHVERLDTTDRPDLVVIQVYITNAKRAYAIAD